MNKLIIALAGLTLSASVIAQQDQSVTNNNTFSDKYRKRTPVMVRQNQGERSNGEVTISRNSSSTFVNKYRKRIPVEVSQEQNIASNSTVTISKNDSSVPRNKYRRRTP